jgi:hypothetical protein
MWFAMFYQVLSKDRPPKAKKQIPKFALPFGLFEFISLMTYSYFNYFEKIIF